MAPCSTGKKIYASAAKAEEALIETWTRYRVAVNNGPIAVYKCDDCGNYHLTSKGAMNTTLQRLLAEGQLKRQQDINFWEDKFKK